MLGSLAMLRETYGSVESYLVDHCQVSRETLERVRRNLVVEVDGEEWARAGWGSEPRVE